MSEDRECVLCGDKCDEVVPVSKTNKKVYVKIIKNHILYDFRRICLECLNKVNKNGIRKDVLT